ncbi:Activator of SKN7 protein 10 [Nakaseomyces bracarensis]|uniref:Activator of SKN7 protein 10 n=1 Tax=Nakaseomyces bracarensis TaxID=273131 RepID=A0ABR4NY97_9SACH
MATEHSRQVSLADDIIKHTTHIGSKLTKVVSPREKDEGIKLVKTKSSQGSSVTITNSNSNSKVDNRFDGFNPKYLGTQETTLYKSASHTPSPTAIPTEYNSPTAVPVPVPENIVDGNTVTNGVGKEQYVNGFHHSQFVKEYPTVLLADRFKKWSKIVKFLIDYLQEAAYTEEQIARMHLRLRRKVNFTFLTDLDDHNKVVDPYQNSIPTKRTQPVTAAEKKRLEAASALEALQKEISAESETDAEVNDEAAISSEGDALAPSGFMKFGSGSIQDVQVVLKRYHGSLAGQQLKVSREIIENVIPKLESLCKDLTGKIREIKDLHGDFKTNIVSHISQTSKLLAKYNSMVKKLSDESEDATKVIQPKCDPYLVKVQLETQLKKQLAEEKYLMEAFINMQSNGLDLERIVYTRIQSALETYSALIDSEARMILKNLCQELQHGILSKPATVEWDQFIPNHSNCMLHWLSNEPRPKPRELSDIVYPNMKAPASKCIRKGYMYYCNGKDRKKFKKGYFILTSHYLHEFKDSDFSREMKTDSNDNYCHMAISLINLIPVQSFALSDVTLGEFTDKEMIFTARPLRSSRSRSTPPPSQPQPEKVRSPSITSAVPKFLRGGKKSSSTKMYNPNIPLVDHNPALDVSASEPLTDIGERTEWHLRLTLGDYDDDFKVQYKKWSSDFKALAEFNHSHHRNSFIGERAEYANRKASRVADAPGLLREDSNNSRGSSETTLNAKDSRSSSKVGNIVGVDEEGNLITSDGRRYSVNPDLARRGSSNASPRRSTSAQSGSPLNAEMKPQERERVGSLPLGEISENPSRGAEESRGSVQYELTNQRTASLPVNDKDAATRQSVPRGALPQGSFDTIDEALKDEAQQAKLSMHT